MRAVSLVTPATLTLCPRRCCGSGRLEVTVHPRRVRPTPHAPAVVWSLAEGTVTLAPGLHRLVTVLLVAASGCAKENDLSPRLGPGEKAAPGGPVGEGLPCGPDGTESSAAGTWTTVMQCSAPLECVPGAVNSMATAPPDGGLCEYACRSAADCPTRTTMCAQGFCAMNFCVSDPWGQPVANGVTFGGPCDGADAGDGLCRKVLHGTVGLSGSTTLAFGLCTRP